MRNSKRLLTCWISHFMEEQENYELLISRLHQSDYYSKMELDRIRLLISDFYSDHVDSYDLNSTDSNYIELEYAITKYFCRKANDPIVRASFICEVFTQDIIAKKSLKKMEALKFYLEKKLDPKKDSKITEDEKSDYYKSIYLRQTRQFTVKEVEEQEVEYLKSTHPTFKSVMTDAINRIFNESTNNEIKILENKIIFETHFCTISLVIGVDSLKETDLALVEISLHEENEALEVYRINSKDLDTKSRGNNLAIEALEKIDFVPTKLFTVIKEVIQETLPKSASPISGIKYSEDQIIITVPQYFSMKNENLL